MRRRGAHPASARTGLVLGVLMALVGAIGAAQGATLAGTFGDGRVALTLRAIGGGQYTGAIELDGVRYPLVASGSPERVEGTFESGGSAFPFVATLAGDLSGDTVTLTSGGNAFTLRRLDGPAATAPAAPATARAIGRATRLSYDEVTVSHPGTSASPSSPGSGVRGLARYEVLHVDDGLCVLDVTVFLQTPTGTGYAPAPQLGRTLVGRDGTCPEVWWPPERLERYAPPTDGSQQVARGPFQLPHGGPTFEALFVRQELAQTRFANTWDLATGLLLMATEGTGPTPAPAPQPTSSSTRTLVDARVVEYPWDVHAPLPPAVQGLQELHVQGTVSRAFVGVVGVGPQVERFETVFEVVERFPSLLLLRPRGGAADAYVALAPTGALYLPPAAAGVLHAGQRFDEDPVAGTVRWVERVDAEAVVLAVEGPGLRSRSTYDPRSGLLVAEVIETDDGATQVTYELRVTGAR